MKKIRVFCKEENRAEIEQMVQNAGFILAADAKFSLIEDDYIPEYLIGKYGEDSVMLALREIIIIETYGRDIIARTGEGDYKLKDTLEHLELILKPAGFFRISQSAIIQKSMIQKISAGFSMKFYLTLKGGSKAEVTRSYYYSFKEFIGL